MPRRVRLDLSDRQRDAFQARVRAEGRTLSEWLRHAARERLERDLPARRATVEDLDRFFPARDAAEFGRGPGWEEHVDVAANSRSAGMTGESSR